MNFFFLVIYSSILLIESKIEILHPLPPGRPRESYNITIPTLGSGSAFRDLTHPDVVQLFGVPYAHPPVIIILIKFLGTTTIERIFSKFT